MPKLATRGTLRVLATAALGAGVLAACTYDNRGVPMAATEMAPAALITGPEQSCIPVGAFSSTSVRNGHTIDFLTSSKRGWRNTLPSDCSGLASERAFTYATSLSQLCSTDVIRVLQNWGGTPRPGATCGLGQFTPIELR